MRKIEKGMSADALFDILRRKMEDVVKQKSYTQVWEIYGEAYMARKLDAITEYHYEKLWNIAYPVMTGVVLVPKT